jgi:kynurenine aminotransferase
MPGGIIRYVPLHPPEDGASRTSSAAEWTVDMDELERTINPKTRMIVREVPPSLSFYLIIDTDSR